MSILHPDAEARARLYLGDEIITEILGWGKDGDVFKTGRHTAIKVYTRFEPFDTELAAYFRLKAHGVRRVAGLAVPQLEDFDRELRVLEISIVSRPYLLDFASAGLDCPPADFPEETVREWHQKIRDTFGARWRDAMGVYDLLRRRYGIYHADLSRNNLDFGDPPEG